MTREGSPPRGMLNGALHPYGLAQCSPSELSSMRSVHHPHISSPPGGIPPHPLIHSGAVGPHFPPQTHGLGGLNEFLWNAAGLSGMPHGSPGLFSTPSILSAFPGLASAGWQLKSPAAASLFAQYMMASNPPVFPFDLSAKSASSGSAERLLNNFSPSNRSRRSDSLSPPSHNSEEFTLTPEHMNSDDGRRGGKVSPMSDDEAIDLAKGSPSSRVKSDNAGTTGYGLTFHGKFSSARSRQESISILRECAAKDLTNGHIPSVKN